MPAMRQLFCNFAAMNTNQGLSFEQLAENIRLVDQSMLGIANKTINQSATLRNWIIGGYIVEYEQRGKDRAEYGDRVITTLAQKMKGSRIDATLLKYSRLFYLNYPLIDFSINRKRCDDIALIDF